MDTSPVIEVTELELDEVFGGKETPSCAQAADGICVSSCCHCDPV